MPKLGLGSTSSSSSIVSPGIPTSGLQLRYDNNARQIEHVSDAAVYFVSGDMIKVADSSDFTFTAGNPFSVGCWFNSPAIGTDHLIGKTNNTSESHANNEWYFHLASGGKLCLQCFDPSESAIIGRKYNTPLSSNTWYYGLATYDGGDTDFSVKIYLNGERVDDSNQNAGSGFTTMDNTATDLTFARTANGSVNYAGYMCNAAIWSRELNETEIRSIMFKQYADLSASEKTNLVSWWNLDSTVKDGLSLVYDENNTTLGANLWDGGDIGPDALGGADTHISHKMDLSDVGLSAGDVIKISGTVSGSNGGRIVCPDTGADSNGVTLITGGGSTTHTADGDIEVYAYVSDVTGDLKIRTDWDGSGNDQDDRTQVLTNISVQKITNAGRLL